MTRDRDRVALTFGDSVRSRREALELSQLEVAGRVGVDRAHLSQIEKGRHCPGLDLALALCRVVGIDDLQAACGELVDGVAGW
ncbi:MAG TPA: helix-turn-helix transcriptional regulator [Candidatus Methylomirabilis sp.]|nr:helix-turn-helix transcriptional regulator [Candidatus Methylomirabilis sp.]